MNFKYYYNWYKYLFVKRKVDISIFLAVMFVLPIIPYTIVAFKLFYFNEEQMRHFYGDGSIIVLCSGILCSFVSIFFEHRDEKEKKRNILMNLCLLIIYIIVITIFIECQLNFNRQWPFIFQIFALTVLILVFTILSALYLNFKLNVNFTDVTKFIEEDETKKIEKKAAHTKKSKSGIEV